VIAYDVGPRPLPRFTVIDSGARVLFFLLHYRSGKLSKSTHPPLDDCFCSLSTHTRGAFHALAIVATTLNLEGRAREFNAV
jgi:hypothetical protein